MARKRCRSAQSPRPSGRADASLSAGLSLLLQSAGARSARQTSSTRKPGRACSARPPALGVLQVHLSGGEPGARRDLRRDHGGGARCRPLHQSHHLGGRHHRGHVAASSPKPGSITCRSRSRTASRIAPTTSPATRAPSRASARSPPKSCDLKIPLTVNAVMHRANIDRIEDMVALALALGASRVEIAHAQYYGWALKNRAALMPTRRAGQARGGRGRGTAPAASRRDRHRCRRPRLLRAAAEAVCRRLGSAFAQRDAGRQGAAVPRRRDRFPASNSGRCASIRSPTSGRIRRPSTPSAAPTGCRSRAEAARGAISISAAAVARRSR